jgi:hypothetical protein
MNSPNESLYSYILRTYHGDEVRKRKKTELFKDVPKTINDIVIPSEGWNPASARIKHRKLKTMIGLLSDEARIFLIFRLFTYLYIRPFLRISVLVFLILFRFYHSFHPEIISARMNESFLIRSFWSNYYNNPGFLTNTYYYPIKPRIQSNLQAATGIQKNLNTSDEVKIGKTNTIHVLSQNENKAIEYVNNSNLTLSNSKMQVVFNKITKNIATKKLLQPVITTLNNTMILVDFTTPLSPRMSISSISSSPSPKTFVAKSRITDQIIIGKPMPHLPTKSKQNKQKRKTTSKNKNTNSKAKEKTKSKRSSRPDSNELIYGYIIPEKRIVVIYDNGIPYIYKASRELINKYLMSSRQLNTF